MPQNPTPTPPRPHGHPTPNGTGTGQPARRNAARTRQALLHAARRRFVRDGYQRTTLRDVAAEAGVNLALVKRYFGSKAGLFEAALNAEPPLLPTSDEPRLTASALAELLCQQLPAGPGTTEDEHPILLFLRDSGDPNTDAIRKQAVQDLSEHLLSATGTRTDGTETEALLLRAQLVVALASGIAVLRTSVDLRPLQEATTADLLAPLTDAISALLRLPPRITAGPPPKP